MKLMIASDIHGSAKWCAKMIEAWRAERPDRLVLLGDLLYHGPRNDLPEDYAPKKVIAMLNAIAPALLCVRGNCEAEVDQMVLDFPVMADYAALFVDGHILYATHGHIYGEDNPPPLQPGDFLLCGHTHVPGCHRHEDLHLPQPRLRVHPQERHAPQLLYSGGRHDDLEGPARRRLRHPAPVVACGNGAVPIFIFSRDILQSRPLTNAPDRCIIIKRFARAKLWSLSSAG